MFFVIPPLTLLLPSTLTERFVRYLPSNAGSTLFGGATVGHPLAPWTGFAAMCSYAVVLLGISAWRLRRADA